MAYDNVVARFTLAGSMISCIATFCVLVSYMVYREELRSFRQALVFNLALAEFLNTLNNSISGCIYIRDETLSPGPACIANGFVNQLTVQAVDFTIMAIVIVTLLTITQKTYLPNVSFAAKTIICLSTWLVPIITSTTAVGMHAMSPVSGNWCWITATRTDLRYALTHGWRIAIIFLTVLLYAYIWWYVRRHFKALFGAERGRSGSYNPLTGQITSEKDRLRGIDAAKVALKERWQHLKVIVDSTDAPSRVRTPSGGALAHQNERDTIQSSIPSQPPIQSWRQQIRGRYQGIDDAAVPGWSPLQKPAQNRPTQQHALFPGASATAEGRNDDGAGDDREAIVRSHDIHVSFAEQHPIQQLPPVGDAGPFPPSYQQPSTWPRSQMTNTSFISTSSSSATKPLVHTHVESQSDFRHGSSSDAHAGHNGRGFEREIRRMLLLNAYPTLYVLLWIPGIVNRLMEATGTSPSNTRIVGALQSTSQFVGFANALTFGLSATMRRRIASAASNSRWVGRRGEV